jgi:hypothetical protein
MLLMNVDQPTLFIMALWCLIYLPSSLRVSFDVGVEGALMGIVCGMDLAETVGVRSVVGCRGVWLVGCKVGWLVGVSVGLGVSRGFRGLMGMVQGIGKAWDLHRLDGSGGAGSGETARFSLPNRQGGMAPDALRFAN